MLTRVGWTVMAVGFGSVVAGRLLGIFELYIIGAGAIVLLVACLASVSLTRLELDVARSLHPPRLHAGNPSRVDLQVRNRSSRRTPLLTLRDPVGKGRSARVVLAPLGQDQSVRAAYRLPTDRRGVLAIGPLQVEVADPFGLASLTTQAAPLTELTVWPAVEDILPMPHTQGDDPHSGADHPNALAAAGEDFYALRPYVVGDDLRRVHWPSTARHDDLMVRQDEMPWQGRASVLLDTRRAAFDADGFERAVSAAASIVMAAWRRRFLLRLMTTAGLDTGFGAGAAHVDSILEHLATVKLVESGRLPAVLARLRRAGNGGSLAALVGGRSPADVDAIARVRPSFGHVTLVSFPAPGSRPPATTGRGTVLVVDDHHPFAPQWDIAMRHSRGPRLAAR